MIGDIGIFQFSKLNLAFNQKIKTKLFIGLGLLFSVIIFIIDMLKPDGIDVCICYTGVVLLSMWTNDKKHAVFATISSVLLIIVGYFLSHQISLSAEDILEIENRILAIFVVVICALVIIKYKKMEEITVLQQRELHQLTINLKATNSHLEERVKERAEVLESALSKLKKSEAELQKSLEQEKELNELKTRFVSTASHEFRTPLTTILSSLALISKYGEQNDKEKQSRHIDRIKSNVTHLTEILNDVLSLSKLEEEGIKASFEKFPVNVLVSEVVREMQLIAKLNQKIQYHHHGLEEIVLDKKTLRHILLNLVTNAIKFSNEDSTVNVVTEVKDSVFLLRVEDSGIGIPPEDQKHLFERFFRGKNVSAIQGTGLGLNIVAKYVELMNGKIGFISKLGEGTTFSVEFNLSN